MTKNELLNGADFDELTHYWDSLWNSINVNVKGPMKLNGVKCDQSTYYRDNLSASHGGLDAVSVERLKLLHILGFV